MTTLGAGLYAYLSQLSCGGNVFTERMPQNVDLSRGVIVWQIVSEPGRVQVHSDAHSTPAPPPARFLRSRVQLSCWARTPEARTALGDEVEAAVEAFSGMMGSLPVGSCLVVLQANDHDEKRGIYRRLVDVIIQYTLITGS